MYNINELNASKNQHMEYIQKFEAAIKDPNTNPASLEKLKAKKDELEANLEKIEKAIVTTFEAESIATPAPVTEELEKPKLKFASKPWFKKHWKKIVTAGTAFALITGVAAASNDDSKASTEPEAIVESMNDKDANFDSDIYFSNPSLDSTIFEDSKNLKQLYADNGMLEAGKYENEMFVINSLPDSYKEMSEERIAALDIDSDITDYQQHLETNYQSIVNMMMTTNFKIDDWSNIVSRTYDANTLNKLQDIYERGFDSELSATEREDLATEIQDILNSSESYGFQGSQMITAYMTTFFNYDKIDELTYNTFIKNIEGKCDSGLKDNDLNINEDQNNSMYSDSMTEQMNTAEKAIEISNEYEESGKATNLSEEANDSVAKISSDLSQVKIANAEFEVAPAEAAREASKEHAIAQHATKYPASGTTVNGGSTGGSTSTTPSEPSVSVGDVVGSTTNTDIDGGVSVLTQAQKESLIDRGIADASLHIEPQTAGMNEDEKLYYMQGYNAVKVDAPGILDQTVTEETVTVPQSETPAPTPEVETPAPEVEAPAIPEKDIVDQTVENEEVMFEGTLDGYYYDEATGEYYPLEASSKTR